MEDIDTLVRKGEIRNHTAQNLSEFFPKKDDEKREIVELILRDEITEEEVNVNLPSSFETNKDIKKEILRGRVLQKVRKYEALTPEGLDRLSFVYALKLEVEIGDKFYYIGETTDLRKRIRNHFNSKKISTPYNMEYEIIDLEEVIPVFGNQKHVDSIERRLANLMVQEKDTLNVIGGT